jgi:hypothetical protein
MQHDVVIVTLAAAEAYQSDVLQIDELNVSVASSSASRQDDILEFCL